MDAQKNIVGKIASISNSVFLAAGLLVFGLSPLMVLCGYILEIAVNYVITLLKLALIGIRDKKKPQGLTFFMFHYGFILLGETVFFIIVCGILAAKDRFILDVLLLITDHAADLSDPRFFPKLLWIFSSISLSFAFQFLFSIFFKGGFSSWTAAGIINTAYGTIILTHVVLFIGSIAVYFLNLPLVLSVVLIAVKAFCDFFMIGSGPKQIYPDSHASS